MFSNVIHMDLFVICILLQCGYVFFVFSCYQLYVGLNLSSSVNIVKHILILLWKRTSSCQMALQWNSTSPVGWKAGFHYHSVLSIAERARRYVCQMEMGSEEMWAVVQVSCDYEAAARKASWLAVLGLWGHRVGSLEDYKSKILHCIMRSSFQVLSLCLNLKMAINLIT